MNARAGARKLVRSGTPFECLERLLGGGLLALLLTAGGAAGQAPSSATVRALSPREAEALLRQRGEMDAKSRQVLQRAVSAYGRLASLETISQDGLVASIARLKRPLLYHNLQRTRQGQTVGLAVSDGTRYHEYQERKREYVERDASLLARLALPVHVRLFFTGQKPDQILTDLDGKPTAREYAFKYGGRSRINGKDADIVRVSVMARAKDGAWHAFESVRYYEAAGGLLLRAVSGKRTLDVENRKNVKLPTDRFRWRPLPGVVRGFR